MLRTTGAIAWYLFILNMEQRKCVAWTQCHRLNKNIWKYTCIFVFHLIFADCFFYEPMPIVHTKWGIIQGKWSKSLHNQWVANFLGIPYALPPVGDLRFRSPQRWNHTWMDIRNATTDGEMCIQMKGSKIFGSEDCLFLNIFIPYISDIQRMKFPVLVFVHGGAFSSGSSNSKSFAPDYLMDQNIILVTLNYRLNILGFFSTTNKVSPGNYGLKDIKMALEWIQENIHSFNGNPKSVTLMGASSGSILVHLLAFSHKTEGLFDKYILLSGTALMHASYQLKETYRQICLKLARLVGCQPTKSDVIASNMIVTGEKNRRKRDDVNVNVSHKDYDEEQQIKEDEEMVKCMRTIDARQLIKMLKHFYIWRYNPIFSFGPTLENDSEDAILTMHPWKVIKNGLFRDIPVIMQVEKDEGLIKTLGLFTDPDMEKELIENFEEYLYYFLENRDWISNISIFTTAIQDFYFNGNILLDFKDSITKVISDIFIMWPTIKSVQYQSKLGNSSVYFSLFQYIGTFSFAFSVGAPIHYGVFHNDDLNYLFPILNNRYRNMNLHNTKTDVMVIDIMTEMWANFMREGIPKARMIPAWPDYRDNHQFIRFGIGKSPDIAVQADFLCDKMEFWDKLLANVSTQSAQRETIIDISLNYTCTSNVDTINCNLTIYLVLLIIALLCVKLFDQ